MTPVNISVTGEDFVSINQEADIPIGTRFQLQTESNYPVIIQRKESKPSTDDTNGRVMKGIKNKSSIYQVREGSEEVWLRLDTDNLLSVGRVSVGLVSVEDTAINYVARLDGQAQNWQFSEPIDITNGEDFSISFYMTGENKAYRGVFQGTDVWCRTLPDTSSHNLQLFIGGEYMGVASTAAYNLFDGEFHKIDIYREGGDVYSVVDDGTPELCKSGAESSFSLEMLGVYNNNRYSCSFYDFKVVKSGSTSNYITLTNKDQGAVQLATVGSINANMVNYTEDVWEVNNANS